MALITTIRLTHGDVNIEKGQEVLPDHVPNTGDGKPRLSRRQIETLQKSGAIVKGDAPKVVQSTTAAK